MTGSPEAGSQIPDFESAAQPETPHQETQNQTSPEIRLGSGNCWETLGLDESASEADISQRFRGLATKYHPDHGGSTDDFKRLKSAYDKAKLAALNGGGNGVAPEATMAAGAGVAASGMTGEGITPEQRRAAMEAMFAANQIAAREADFHAGYRQADDRAKMAEMETRIKEADIKLAQARAEQKVFDKHILAEAQRVSERAAAEVAAKKAEEERISSILFNDPDQFYQEMYTSAIKSVLTPLRERGLLSEKTMNEFMAVGRALQIEADRSAKKIREGKPGEVLPGDSFASPEKNRPVKNFREFGLRTDDYIISSKDPNDPPERLRVVEVQYNDYEPGGGHIVLEARRNGSPARRLLNGEQLVRNQYLIKDIEKAGRQDTYEL